MAKDVMADLMSDVATACRHTSFSEMEDYFAKRAWLADDWGVDELHTEIRTILRVIQEHKELHTLGRDHES